MTIKLASALPRGSANGLGTILMDLVRHPDRFKVVLAIVDTKELNTNTDTGEVVPTMRIRRIEAVTGQDLPAARLIMERTLERRTGRVALPLDLADELAEAFAVDGEG